MAKAHETSSLHPLSGCVYFLVPCGAIHKNTASSEPQYNVEPFTNVYVVTAHEIEQRQSPSLFIFSCCGNNLDYFVPAIL